MVQKLGVVEGMQGAVESEKRKQMGVKWVLPVGGDSGYSSKGQRVQQIE